MKRARQIRIIGGQWKRRHILFPNISGLRPSLGATRETVFNWLRNNLLGSICLDLYAGSGAFGFEAASRGATAVVMVDSHRRVIQSLRQTKDLLDADNLIEICRQEALPYLKSAAQKSRQKSTLQKFDVVFMDPPFRDAPISEICDALIAHHWLSDEALIYIESQKSNYPLPIPSTWHIIRESQRGMVQSTLIATDIRKWQK